MRGSRFPWRVFSRFVLIQAVLLILAFLALALFVRSHFKEQFLNQTTHQLKDYLEALSKDLPEPLKNENWCRVHADGTDYRLTLISDSGEILCDSHHDPHSMDNHINRPEVVQAGEAKFGSSIRYSDTLKVPMLYGATRYGSSNSYIRGALSLEKLEASLQTFDRTVWFFALLIVVVAFGLSVSAARRMVFPLGRLMVKSQEYVPKGVLNENENLDEWSNLEVSLEYLQKDLRSKEDSLSRGTAELSTLMTAISDSILAVDLDGTPMFFNPQFAALFDKSNLLKNKYVKIWEMFRNPDILEAFQKATQTSVDSRLKAIQFEINGFTKYFSVAVSPLKWESGKTYGAMGVFHDVTELKMAEQIRIDFVANVSHELRTPLAAIKGYSDTILADVNEGKKITPELLEPIKRNTERLMNLISDLLDLSFIESAKNLEGEKVSTEDITSKVVKTLNHNFEAKSQNVSLNFSCKQVFADYQRLEQVLTNLLDNACKYSPNGSKISVSWEQGTDYVLLKVSDNGPGISPEFQSRLFERFFRVDKARSKEMGGTGLGLAIVKHILLSHGGTIEVQSQLGAGTTFICKFPSS